MRVFALCHDLNFKILWEFIEMCSFLSNSADISKILKAANSKSIDSLLKDSPSSCLSSPNLSSFFPSCLLAYISATLQGVLQKSEKSERAYCALYMAFLFRFYGVVLQKRRAKVCACSVVGEFLTW